MERFAYALPFDCTASVTAVSSPDKPINGVTERSFVSEPFTPSVTVSDSDCKNTSLEAYVGSAKNTARTAGSALTIIDIPDRVRSERKRLRKRVFFVVFYRKKERPTLQKMKSTATVMRYGQISPSTYNICVIPVVNVSERNVSRVLVAITIVVFCLCSVTD